MGSKNRQPPAATAPGYARTTDPLADVDKACLPASDAVTMLRVVSGELELSLALTKPSFTLGSAPEVDLPVPIQYVSRLHAAIERDGNWLIVTNRSQNGTTFGGRAEPRAPVKAGDCFTIGQTTLLALDDHMIALRRVLLRQLGYRAHEPVDRALIDVMSGRQATLVLTGPHGSEFERLASDVHRTSPRRGLPFEILDPEMRGEVLQSAVERAGAGTLFADLRPLRGRAASDALAKALLGPRTQARAILAATDPASARSSLKDRGDNFAVIATPAIAERREDVPALLDSFLAEAGTTKRLKDLPPARAEAVCAFAWPHNLLDLRRNAQKLAAYLDADGNLNAAARALGVDDTTLGEALERIDAIVRGRSRKGSRSDRG